MSHKQCQRHGTAHRQALGVKLKRTGAIAFTQRFSSRLLFYPHVHCAIPDGVFAQDATGKVVFHKLRLRQEDVSKIVSKIARRAAKVLAKLDAEAIEPDALDAVRGMSQQGELAIKVASVEKASGRMPAWAVPLGRSPLQAACSRRFHSSPGIRTSRSVRPPLPGSLRLGCIAARRTACRSA